MTATEGEVVVLDDAFEAIRQSLALAAQQYRAAEEGGRLDFQSWQENVRLLKPITDQLQREAQARADQCRTELDRQNEAKEQLLADRAQRYAEVEAEKGKLSDLDAQILALTTRISAIDQEIVDKRKEVEKNQEALRRAKEGKKKWSTVFWCTCWIPFVNIGTGVKKIDVDNEYAAKAKVLDREIRACQARAADLNRELERLRGQEREKDEVSRELARRITTIDGRVATITAEINSLSGQINLWRAILETCRTADTQLAHADGDLKTVRECFAELQTVEKLLRAPTTTRFVEGRTCRGACLRAGETLEQGEYLISPNGRFIAVLDGENELAVCSSRGKLWTSGTQGAKGEGQVRLDGHGPVALVGADQAWNTKRPGAVSLVMQDDGDLVAYDAAGQTLWASDTYTYANVDVDSLRFQVQRT